MLFHSQKQENLSYTNSKLKRLEFVARAWNFFRRSDFSQVTKKARLLVRREDKKMRKKSYFTSSKYHNLYIALSKTHRC